MIFDKLKYRWHLLPINRQLIVLVTASLLGFVVVFLTVDHGLRTECILSEKQSVLTNEAKTLYEGLRVVEHHGDAAIHDFIDNVANGMNATESARHHILAHWNGRRYESLPHKMPAGSTSVSWNIELDLDANHSIVRDNEIIGAFKGPLGSVYVLEHRDSALDATHYSLLSQTVGVITLGAIAAIAASIVLRQLVAKPIQRLVSTLQGVGAGDLSVVARTRSCQVLRYLAKQINKMTRSLEHAQRDHRLHMEKARQIQQNLRPSLTELAGVDVAGHGVPAAMAATLLKAFVSEATKQSVSPATILTEVNQRYCEYVMMGHFATMCLVVIDNANQSLTYASAGHESPIVQMDSAKPTRLEAGDLPLGVEETTIYGEETVEVRGRTRIVIVSDGVSESFNPFDEQFGTERIEEIISQQTENSAADVVQDLRASLESFRAGCQPFDDTTLLVAQFTGANDVPDNGDSLSEHKRTIGCRTYRKTQSIAS